MPLVSVVIPTYKRPDKLRRAIESALQQTVEDTEVVVAVEQGDPDSIRVVERLAHPRVRYVLNGGSRGPGPNRDSGALSSKGKWIAFLDDDDEWLPHKLERQLAVAQGEDDKLIISSQAYVTLPDRSSILPSAPYDPEQLVDEWLFDRRYWLKPRGSFAQTSTLLVPRRVFERLRFGPSRHEDWEFVIRAVKQEGYRLVTVMTPLVHYHAGGSYQWEDSLIWVDQVRDLLSPRAYSGFCLTVVSRILPSQGRLRVAWRLLAMAFRHGRPTAKQLLAFLWITVRAPP